MVLQETANMMHTERREIKQNVARRLGIELNCNGDISFHGNQYIHHRMKLD